MRPGTRAYNAVTVVLLIAALFALALLEGAQHG